jgi:hypothetical protein
MSLRGRVCGLALGIATSALGLPALAQQATTCPPSLHNPADGPFGVLSGDLLQTPCVEPSLPPATVAPMPSKPRSDIAPPAGAPAVADLHAASTALGFHQSIAPASGRTVGYRGLEYLVVEVTAVGDGPIFSGGSRFVITTEGGALDVGLKAMDERERRMAAASVR